MSTYIAPTRDLHFVLHDVLNLARTELARTQQLDAQLTQSILDAAGRFAAERLAPLNAAGDADGCHFIGGHVTTPTGFADAYKALCDDGWHALDAETRHGGAGMPYVLYCATGEMFAAANMALNVYQGLTHAAISAIAAHGTQTQKATFLPRMIAGTWSGTMNLTEPQCGTDLSLIRTRAMPAKNGTYRVTGQKIWISGGDQDLTENIIHLVLARTPDAPAGTKGLSLFIVPKILIDADGGLGVRNAVDCVGLADKMGLHGNATCEMRYDGATGYLLGTEGGGLPAMFTMMNEARIGVGLQGYAQADRAYQIAAAFARDRLQGRSPAGPENPDGPADAIIAHPDIRRELMDQRALIEGGRALTLWVASLVDRARVGDAEAEALAALLTPVVKGFLTDQGLTSTVRAQQVLGGAGYVRDHGIEQIVRDTRITMTYEGANGIQALDLVGRKLARDGGQALRAFLGLIETEIAAAAPALQAEFAGPLSRARDDLAAAAVWLAQHGVSDPRAALAGAHDMLHLMGHVALGWMWLRMAGAALRARGQPDADTDFLDAKLVTGQHYMTRHLPATALHRTRIEAGATTITALNVSRF